jgi:hypothetical protein
MALAWSNELLVARSLEVLKDCFRPDAAIAPPTQFHMSAVRRRHPCRAMRA